MRGECKHIYGRIEFMNGDIMLRCIRCNHYILLKKNGYKEVGYLGEEGKLLKTGKIHNWRM